VDLKAEADDHGPDHKRIDFKEYHGNCHFAELKQMQEGFLPTTCRLDGSRPVAEIIGEAGGEPHWQHEKTSGPSVRHRCP
jgi:hypothetical protein